MTDETPERDDALLSRLRGIENQPLDERADAYELLNDELRAVLERGDVASPHG